MQKSLAKKLESQQDYQGTGDAQKSFNIQIGNKMSI